MVESKSRRGNQVSNRSSQLARRDERYTRTHYTANFVSGKKYSTADQRKILALAGVEHVAGRSFDEAESLIDANINLGILPPDIRDRASIRQLAVLDKIGVEYPDNISKSGASQLIDQHTEPTEKQLEFLHSLGSAIPHGLTRKSASALIDQYTQVGPIVRLNSLLIWVALPCDP